MLFVFLDQNLTKKMCSLICPKKCYAQEIKAKKNLGPKTLGQNRILVPNIFWQNKNLGTNLGSKYVWSKKGLGKTKIE